MQHLEVSCAVRRIYKSLGFKGLIRYVPRHGLPWDAVVPSPALLMEATTWTTSSTQTWLISSSSTQITSLEWTGPA